jgi:hypothetical protein
MVLKGMKDKVGEKAASAKDAALEKISQSLDKFNEAIPAIKALGFAVTDLNVDMGAIPDVSAKITGSIDSIEEEKIKELIGSNEDNKFLVTVLKGLQTASNIQNKLGDLGFKGVEAEVKLSPPGIKVGFL